MKIQPILPQLNQNNNNPNFKGTFETASSLLRFLDTNQAWGANAVDLCSMVIPRTAVDFINRGPEAGTETARRESMGTFNHSMVGVYGTAAGLALAATLNNKFGIKAHKIFADNEAYSILTKSFDTNSGVENHLKYIFSQLETSVDGAVKHLSDSDIEKLTSKFSAKMNDKNSALLLDKELLGYSKAVILKATGSEKGFKFKGANNTFTLESGLKNIYNVTKALIARDEKGVSSEVFLRTVKKMNINRSIAGLGIAAAIGMSTQPINMYLTKKKTGSDGFVGVPGRQKDNSAEFKLLKGISALGFGVGALATITTNYKRFLSKIQFQGMSPTVSQLKLVYGLTIASRLLAARDKDELRESMVKDSLGFLNLLVLGSLVTKGVARLFDKSLINVSKDDSKNFFKWLMNSSLKTRDEVLYAGLKNKDIFANGKPLPFKELIKLADKSTKGKLRALNIAQVVGYLYSGIVLGVGVPKLNIYMTNKADAKRKAKLNNNPQLNDQYNAMLVPHNLEFLSKKM